MGLQLIESGLINVYQDNSDEMLINARELHSFLMVGRDFTTWMKDRLEKYGFEAGVDYILTLTKTGERKNVTRHEYFLKLDTAKEIAMVENNARGRLIRRHFIEIEKQFRNRNLKSQPRTTGEFLLLVAQQFVEHERKMAELEKRQKEQEQRVASISSYLVETPDRTKVDRKVKEYARRHHAGNVNAAWREVYRMIKDKYGIDVLRRVENERQRINHRRIAEGLMPYTFSTLKHKVNGMDILCRMNMLSDVLEIVAGLSIKGSHKIS
ncbi:phage anti-repressor protein [Brevibacillus aydinogluensis]|uniref:antA/AntB antirepressor family protein n=1 Tax=Brevibacillus aydinogluensis TaxID=927786 RepID=UPI002892D896|nr:antA/AntB antirepressor family protein [Brevibacillus aydinogluensis]MDT3417138.1 phage anti-repressor protein [Brevibacillus aydinogluensis]